MIIIRIKAGLGNQMFQYAFGKALSLERKEHLFLDISSFQNQPAGDAKRAFVLDKFTIQADVLDEATTRKYNSKLCLFLRKIGHRLRRRSAYTYYPNFLNSTSTYFEGYWINQNYFIKYRDEIINSFKLKNNLTNSSKKILDEINKCKENEETSVSISIRRGDFVSNPNSAFNGILGVPHYQKAIDFLQKESGLKNFHVFVFSDDIEWAKENLILPCTLSFVSHPNIPDYEELILISKCSHNIIANSTFSWWGAWLNQNEKKIVVAPAQWLKESSAKELDLLPPEWKTV